MPRTTGEHKCKLIHAFHEASHVCAALALDVEIDSVTIEPSADGIGGHVIYSAWRTRRLELSTSSPDHHFAALRAALSRPSFSSAHERHGRLRDRARRNPILLIVADGGSFPIPLGRGSSARSGPP